VLIHGASGNLRDFTFAMADRLADRYRVIAFDRPGLGHTDRINTSGATIRQQADLLARAADRIGADHPVLVGQSYGGAVALAWAVDNPDRLSALVLLAAASNPWDSGLPVFYGITSSWWGRIFVAPLLAAWVPDRVVDDAIDRVFLPDSAPPGYHAHIGAGLTLRPDTIRANAMQRRNLLAEIRALVPHYGAIAVPTEIVHGDADTTVGLPIHSIPLSGQIPGAALTVLDGVGHMPQHAAPEAVDAAIDRAAARAGLR